jgi:hypothetical protein
MEDVGTFQHLRHTGTQHGQPALGLAVFILASFNFA